MDKIAILYQANLPPLKDGIQKPMKPGGYSDSGADIAFELSKYDLTIITPVQNPNANNDKDWVFPDTISGIEEAIALGANTFWLNTVLYDQHPIVSFFNRGLQFVGQDPLMVDMYDDKFHTNGLLKSLGIPIPDTILMEKNDIHNAHLNVDFPVVIKPLRGRGSQGVTLVQRSQDLQQIIATIFSQDTYGNAVYLERFLSGQEITITVMPSGKYILNKNIHHFANPWCLPAVRRFNHINGIAPYNGTIAVMENSAVLNDNELASEAIHNVYASCAKAAEIIQIKAPIRIDCRADESGKYYLFDVNMKPNMSGPSRSHRKNQDSLTLLAARKIGWNYFDLLQNMLGQKWNKND